MQKSDILFLDIETVPITYNYTNLPKDAKLLWDKKNAYSKEQTAEELYAKAGIFAEFAKVIVIGVGYYNADVFRIRTFSGDDELEILKQFSDFLTKYFSNTNQVLCAHNGKEFDFPFLCRRFIINSIPLPNSLNIQGKKPWEIKHIDTMEMWKFGDYKNYTSLNLLAYALNIPSPKDDIDGSEVSKVYYEQKNLNRIETYCKKDVLTLARIYNRFIGEKTIEDNEVIYA
ncbi:MAG: 3'-5' exonuclease [Bacteroidetes bacterium]|nr:3'-5' exonuclease [Bacteroidota bacterium]